MSFNPTLLDNVRTERMNEHFTKHHLGNGLVLHHFTAALDTQYHDHPWPFRSLVLKGGYNEVELLPQDGYVAATNHCRREGSSHEVQAGTIHIITELLGPECWTLITPGDKEREPGFYEVRGGRLWHRYWFEPTDAWQPWPRPA